MTQDRENIRTLGSEEDTLVNFDPKQIADSPLSDLIGDPFLPYHDFIKKLRKEYKVSVFSYDWRRSCFYNAKMLKAHLERLKKLMNAQKFTIISHSLGGLIARCMIETDDNEVNGSRLVNQLITVGTPHLGAPEMFTHLIGKTHPLDDVPIINKIVTPDMQQELIQYLDSAIELLPVYPFVLSPKSNKMEDYRETYKFRVLREIQDKLNKYIDEINEFLEAVPWVPLHIPRQRTRDVLKKIEKFRKNLIPLKCLDSWLGRKNIKYNFIGVVTKKKATILAYHRASDDLPLIAGKVFRNYLGDGTVPLHSSVPNTQRNQSITPYVFNPTTTVHNDLFNYQKIQEYCIDVIEPIREAKEAIYQKISHRPTRIQKAVKFGKNIATEVYDDAKNLLSAKERVVLEVAERTLGWLFDDDEKTKTPPVYRSPDDLAELMEISKKAKIIPKGRSVLSFIEMSFKESREELFPYELQYNKNTNGFELTEKFLSPPDPNANNPQVREIRSQTGVKDSLAYVDIGSYAGQKTSPPLAIGGFLFLPTACGSSLFFITWNVGSDDRNWAKGNNPQHAEQQFTAWFYEWVSLYNHPRIKIKPPRYLNGIHLINRGPNPENKEKGMSPCTGCCSTLSGLLVEAKKKSSLINARIEWSEVYRGFLETTLKSLDELSRPGWKFTRKLKDNIKPE